MPAYVDCPACACLIRALEPSCPFCGAAPPPVSHPVARPGLGLGLVLSLGLASISCTGGNGGTSTAEDDSQEADAVTYAGPDSWDTTDQPPTTNDSQDADAVTYGGPDESTSITGGVTGTGTDTGTSDSSGTSATESGEVCEPITEDASGIGLECENDGDCLDGYTCQAFQGIVLTRQCQILCEQTCQCPAGLGCVEIADKSGVPWHQCM